MPTRKITIPEPIQLLDASNGSQALVLTFGDFLERVFANPIWNESWRHGLAQRAIARALEVAVAERRPLLEIAEEDWTFLEAAVKHPKTAVGIGGVIPGFGFVPSVARFIVPMQIAIIEAERV